MKLKSLLQTSFLFRLSSSIQTPTKPTCLRSHHISCMDADHQVATCLCNSIRRGLNWSALSTKFNSVCLNSAIVERVLLEFKDPVEAKRALNFFHWTAHCKGFEHSIRPYCIAIHIMAHGRLIEDARALLESVLQRNPGGTDGFASQVSIIDCLLSTYKVADSCPFVFDLLIQCYSKLRLFETAFGVCCYMEKHGFCPSLITFNKLLHVIQKSPSCGSSSIWKIYGYMIERRVYGNETTVKIMIDALCKEGELQKFVDIASRINGKRCSPVVIVNTTLVLMMLEEGRIDEGILVLKRLLQKNMILDTVCCSLIVYAKMRMGSLDAARKAYEEMLERGFSPNAYLYTKFIGEYCNKEMIEEARNLFHEMTNMGAHPYAETYNIVIAGLSRAGKTNDGLRFCEEMIHKGMLPSLSSLNELVRWLCEAGNVEQANKTLTLLLDKGFLPDEITYSHLIKGYCEDGNIQEVLKLYYEMEQRSLSPGLPVFASLISIFCGLGKLNDAEKYFSAMRARSLHPNASIYESLISSHLKKGNKERASCLRNEMVEKGLNPSAEMVVC